MWLVPNRTIDVMAVASNLPMNDPPEWSAGATYSVGARVQRNRREYQNTLAGSVGIDPALVNQSADAPDWLVDGYINAVRPFDGVLANKLTATRGAAISIEYQGFGVDPDFTAVVLDFPVAPAENILTLFGVDASRVRIIGISAGGAVVYNQTRVTGGRWVTGFYEWFTTPLSGFRRIQVFDGLPLSCARLLVCLEGENVALGEATIGKGLFIGTAQMQGTGAGNRSASFFEVNQFGNATIVKRPTRREVTHRVHLTRDHFERIEGLLSDMTGGLVTGIGSVDRPTSISFGVMGEIDWDESMPQDYFLTFTIKGVT